MRTCGEFESQLILQSLIDTFHGTLNSAWVEALVSMISCSSYLYLLFLWDLQSCNFYYLLLFFSFWSAALTDPRQKIIAIREGGYALVKEYLIIYYHYIIIYFKAFPALNILEFSQSESICTVSALTLSPDIMSVMSSLWSRLDTCWVVAPAPLQNIFWGGLKTHSTDGR